MAYRYFLGFLLLLSFTCTTWGDSSKPKLDLLWLANSSGSWVDKGEFGYYRVMVYRVPGESGSSDSIFVDILKQISQGVREIKISYQLDFPSYKGYVQNISFKKLSETDMAILIDVEMNGMNGLVLREVFVVSPEGKSRKLVEAEYKDIY